MFQRRIYAHWLDPGYLGKQAVPKERLGARIKEFEGMLKMHALSGDVLCISDVQLIESHLLLYLFQDPEFGQFISQHPDFLVLVARPTDVLQAESERLAQIESGMVRILQMKDLYFSHTFNSPETMRRVAELFRGIDNETGAEGLFSMTGAFTNLLRDYAENDRPLVAGLYSGLKHFIFDKRARVALPPTTEGETSYFEEIRNIYDRLGNENPKLKQLLSRTLALAEQQTDQYRRVATLAALPHASESGHPEREIFLTVIQAWNLAVGRTIGADSDSAFCFRDAFPIPVHAGSTSGSTFVTRAAQEREFFADITHCSWHPATLRWLTLSRIRTECAPQITAFQQALSGTLAADEGREISPNIIGDKFKLLTDAAGRIIAENQPIIRPAPEWLVSASHITALGVALGLVFFGPIRWKLLPSRHPLPQLKHTNSYSAR